MKRIFKILFLFTFCFVKKTESQNLVPNPSFENFMECPDTATSPLYMNLDSTWFQFNSADYFNGCDITGYRGTPINQFGYEYPNSGNAYIGLITYYGTMFNREYIEVKLNTTLVINQTYYVQFYVSLADTVQYAIENIGALFTDTLFDPFPFPTYNWVTGIPQVENPVGNMLNDKLNWVAITGSFVASGGEKYMTIGNFKNDAQTVKQYFGGTDPSTLEAYYFIDDVYVGTTPLGVEDHKKEKTLLKLYPNPSNGNMTLECNLQEHENGELIIYTLAGSPVKIVHLDAGIKTLTIYAANLQAGMYLYEIRINGKGSRKNKLTIIK